MKVVLIGSVLFSREMLEVLLEERPPGITLAAVFGVPPRHAKGISDYADLEPLARKAKSPYHPFHKINSPRVLEAFRVDRPECTLVFGLSQLLSGDLLKLTGLTIGTHPALLPDGRGRAAIPWSILLGWKRSGISFFGVTEGVDEGLIYEQEAWDIAERDDAETIYGKMCAAGRKAFKRLLSGIASGNLVGTPQGKPQIGPLPRRTPSDGRIDWQMTAQDVDRLIRATTHPYPGAFVELGKGFPSGKLIMWKSAGVVATRAGEPGTVIGCDDAGIVVAASPDAVKVTDVEFEGTGVRLRPGDRFGGVFREGQRLK